MPFLELLNQPNRSVDSMPMDAKECAVREWDRLYKVSHTVRYIVRFIFRSNDKTHDKKCMLKSLIILLYYNKQSITIWTIYVIISKVQRKIELCAITLKTARSRCSDTSCRCRWMVYQFVLRVRKNTVSLEWG